MQIFSFVVTAVVLSCVTTFAASCNHGDIRLIGGSSPYRGRVEVCLFNMWGTVCDHHWSSLDARVACRQLGYYRYSAIAYSNAYFGQGSGPILLDNVACTGLENALVNCSFDNHTGDCRHSDDAGVHCYSTTTGCVHGDIRLAGSGTSSTRGRVEVCLNNVWGSVCDDLWSSNDARVACRQLGYSDQSAFAYSNARYGQGSGSIHLDNLACTGSEGRLIDCSYDSHTADCTHSEDAGLSCSSSCTHGDSRLVGGSYANEGRVEVCRSGSWGTVCDDFWSSIDARVVCRQLGFSRTSATAYLYAYFGRGTGSIFLDDVSCTGTELRLIDCSYDSSTIDCSHYEDAGARCQVQKLCNNGDIRLAGSSIPGRGRVEICWNEAWGTVCDDLWSSFDANVACRQLGFSSTGATAYSSAAYGRGTGPILLDDLRCTNTESRLVDCPHRGIGVHDCSHSEDAAVLCQGSFCVQGAIRLIGGTSSREGRVEVCINNQWGTVCDDFWGTSDANVACRQLGYSGTGAVAYRYAYFGRGSGPILMDDVSCRGSELALINCSYDRSTIDCSHYEDAGVRCQSCTYGTVRLVGGTLFNEGRVEVCKSGQWGTVCDDFWGSTDAGVVCRQLGYSRYSALAYTSANFGQGTGSIWIDDAQCTGSESRLIDCRHDTSTIDCRHSDDAGVRCNTVLRCQPGQLRLVGGTLSNEGRVEVCLNEIWGTVCDDLWSSVDAGVACRQLGYSRLNAVAYSNAHYGQGTGSIWLDNLACTGSEYSLTSCSYDSDTTDCGHYEDAGVRCNTTLLCSNGDLRLAGSSVPAQGRVELCWNETWGTICDGFWSTNDANVACRQLGYAASGSTAYYNAYFGRGTGPILLDDLLCTGSEARIIDCPRSTSQGIGTYDFCYGHSDDAGVRCVQPCAHGEIRLVGGTTPNRGRVEVCLNNVWGTVCDDFWSSVDANVACRQLGYLGTNAIAYSYAYFGAGSGPILLDDVRCTGSETALINCTYDRYTSDCSHYEDAGVYCQVCANGDIQLVGGTTGNEGRVEVCKNQLWGTVCDDFWSSVDANVACGQLGFSRFGATAYSNAYYGAGSGRIHLDNVACTGTESHLVNCSYDPITTDCSHSDDAGARCRNLTCINGAVRLIGGSVATAGRVEVCRNETWGTVCDDSWSDVDASVVCRQLGYSRFNATAYTRAYFGPGNGSILLDDVACVGNETRLVDCQSTTIHNCVHNDDAGVSCKNELLCLNGDIRLVNGNTAFEGRVEICWNETWGTVCDGLWSGFDAQVACRQLGFSTIGYTYYSNAYFGQGFGPILLDDLLCRGTEAKLIDCPRSTSQGIGTHDYCRGHLDDAGLRCRESCPSGGIRLVGGTTDSEGRVEVCLSGRWGTVCDDYWSSIDARVACRQLGFSTTGAVAFSSAYFGRGTGSILLDDVACTGYESRLINCRYDSYTYDCGHYEDAGVRCQGCTEGAVRLRGGTNTSEGRVEVCRNNAWGTVCDDFWGNTDANVVCRQLGYSRYNATAYNNAHFGQGSGAIILDDVQCTGTEVRLLDCPFDRSTVDCTHSEDAGVRCQITPLCRDGQLRLSGGSTANEGRVEICFNETWGTVCDDGWDNLDASVVCRKLQYSRYNNTALLSASFGQGTGPIFLDNVACVGTESSLEDCTHDPSALDCTHHEDAAVHCNTNVVCNNGDIRLMGGSNQYQGRVEVCWNETWGTVCDGYWSSNDANVACRQLGYSPSGAVAYYNAYFGRGTGPILLDDLLCTGSEARLVDCTHDGIGNYDYCSSYHNDDAGVRCQPACTEGSIRLSGYTSFSYQGRVEVCLNRQWGTVCDDHWSSVDANVACRQLGFSRYNATAYTNAYFGIGSGPIHLDDLACTGTETALVNCSYDPHTADCSHFEDAGVRCSQILLCNNGDVRLVATNGSRVNVSEGRVEICFSETWGTVADDGWGTNDAGVVCRQLGFSRHNAQAFSNAYFGQGSGPIYLDNVACGTSQNRLINCSFDMNTAEDTHAEDAGVRCSRTPRCYDGDIRLVGGTLEEEGRVEVCMNEAWGTVCDDGWSNTDANVVCRQLGYSRYNAVAYSSAHYGQGTGPIILDDVACTGIESRLVNCRYDRNTADCSHSEDASVRCNTTFICNNGDIRLVGGSNINEGRVEVCWNETWGTVCDGLWSVNDGNVACRQLGFLDNGATIFSNAYFGRGSGPILLDDLLCTGSEARLVDCPRSTSQGIGTYDFCFGHYDDAGVRCVQPCTDGGIRLVGGTLPNEGRIEVCLNRRWGTVCDDAWDRVDAGVACRQLGYSGHNATAYTNARYGQGTGPIHMDNVACNGSENALLNCTYDSDSSDCYHFEDASVLCQACSNGQIRLVGGSAPNEGRVEVCHNQAWGTVCDDHWGSVDASVTCRQLGYSGQNAIAFSRAHFGQGSGAIVLDNVACTGLEEKLVDCPYDSHTADCYHYEDAGIRCPTTIPVCQHGDVQLVGGTNNSGRVEICLHETWGTVCDDLWSAEDANVVCRQLGFSRHNATVHSGASFGQGSGPIYVDDASCTGMEARLIDCSYDRSTSDCSHSRDAGVTCETELLCQNGDIRLSNGTTVFEGRVEICWNETWGTVCDGAWSSNDATVACRQLGYPTIGATPLYNAAFGQGTGPILLDDLFCVNTEAQLVDCQHDGIGQHDFCRGHLDDAGLRCAEPCLDDSIRLLDGASPYEGRVEVCKIGVWGTVCDDFWDITDASVACRQLGFSRHNANAYSRAYFGSGSTLIHLDDVACSGNETSLLNCSYDIHTGDCSHSDDAGVRCSPVPICRNGDIRLANGSIPQRGRVEICWNETWGTVCDGLWTTNDGNVACRQAGYSRFGAVVRADAFFGQGTGPILLDDLRCTGTETRLVDCPSNGIGISNHCNGHADDAGVQCQPLICQDGEIRLAGGSTQYEGRVEVCLNETWGTVCDNSWDAVDANVACGQLGLSRIGSQAVLHAAFGTGSGPIFLNNVACSGIEVALVNCSHSTAGFQTCSHFSDAGVRCNEQQSYPSPVIVIADSPTSVNLTWGRPAEIQSAILRYNINCTSGTTSISVSTPDDRTSVILPGLRANTNYSCCVTTIATLPEGSSACNSTRTPEDRPSASPTRLQGRPLNSSAVLLSWKPPPSDELNGVLRLYGISITDPETRRVWQQNSTSNVSIIGSLEPCTTYRMTVAAFTVEYGPSSFPIFITTNLEITGPQYSVTMNIVVLSNTSITVVWTAPNALINQQLRNFIITVRDLSTAIQYSHSATVFAQALANFTFSGLAPYVPYQVNLTAVVCGIPVPLASHTVFTQEGVPSVGPSITNTTRTSGVSASLQWEPLPLEDSRGYVTSYSVTYSQRTDILCLPPNTWIDAANFTTHNVTYVINGLIPYLSYCVVVSASTSAGVGIFGPPSEIPAFTIISPASSSTYSQPSTAVTSTQLQATSSISTSTQSSSSSGSTSTRPSASTPSFSSSTSTSSSSFSSEGTSARVPSTTSTRSASTVTPSPTPGPSVCTNGDIRLVDGTTQLEGRVEVCWDNIWGTVCDGSWTSNDGNVACRQLRFSRNGAVVYPNAHFGRGTGPILLDDLLCTGREARLIDCTSDGVGNYDNCNGHADDAGVRCQPALCENGELRLMGGSTEFEGRVEMCWNEEWGTICSDAWDATDAGIACRQLGNSQINAQAVLNAAFGQGTGRILLDNVICTGTELRLVDCAHGTIGDHSCGHHEDAGVRCQQLHTYPSFVVAEPESSSSIHITWGQPSDITSTISKYRITCSVAATATSVATRQTQDNTTTVLTLSELYAYTNYNCCVTAIDITLTESPAACNTTSTLEDVPTGAPFQLQGNAINSSALQLSWQPPAQDELNGILRLYAVTIRDAGTGQLSQQNATTSSIIITSLKPCTAYECSVAAFTVGFGPTSEEYSVLTHPQLTGAPYAVTTSISIISVAEIQILWRTPPALLNQDVTSFDVSVRSLSSTNSYHRTQSVTVAESPIVTATELVPQVPYEVNISVTACGRVAQVANQIAFTRQGVPTVSPTIRNATRTNPTTAFVAWELLKLEQSQGFITSYSVKYIQRIAAICTPPSSWNADPIITEQTALNITELNAVNVYCVSVAASTSAGTGPFGEASEITYFASTDFEIRIAGVSVCSSWSTTDTQAKIQDLQVAIANILGTICSCNFLPSLITSGRWLCDPDNPDDVIFEASIIDGGTFNGTSLISNLQSWALSAPRVEVGGIPLTVTGACSSENCIGSTDSTTITSTPPSPFGSWIYAVIAGVAVIALIAACVVIFLLRRKRRKSRFNMHHHNHRPDPVVENPIYEEQDAFSPTLTQGYNPQPPPVPPPRVQLAAGAAYQQPRSWIGFTPPGKTDVTYENRHGKMGDNTYANAQGKMGDNTYANSQGKMENPYVNSHGKRDENTYENTYENPHAIFPVIPAPNVQQPAAYDAPGNVFFDFDSK